MDNLVQLVTDIRLGHHNGDNTMAAFLDVSSAYDYVLYTTMIDKLVKENCPNLIVKYVEEWMAERKVKFVINKEETIIRNVYKGLPQGAVVSPILYDIYTNNITNNIEQQVNQMQFADDIAIYVTKKTFGERSEHVKRAVERLKEELAEIGLDLQPKKTVIMDFDKKNTRPLIDTIQIAGENIKISRETKFLGIIFDNKLKFEKQCSVMKEKARRANSVLKYCNGISKGMEVNTALMLYKSLVRSTIEYGLPVYFPRDDKNCLVIERAQYAGLRAALGYRNSTPNNVMLGEAKVMSMKDRAAFLARNYMIKMMIYGDSELKKKNE